MILVPIVDINRIMPRDIDIYIASSEELTAFAVELGTVLNLSFTQNEYEEIYYENDAIRLKLRQTSFYEGWHKSAQQYQLRVDVYGVLKDNGDFVQYAKSIYEKLRSTQKYPLIVTFDFSIEVALYEPSLKVDLIDDWQLDNGYSPISAFLYIGNDLFDGVEDICLQAVRTLVESANNFRLSPQNIDPHTFRGYVFEDEKLRLRLFTLSEFEKGFSFEGIDISQFVYGIEFYEQGMEHVRNSEIIRNVMNTLKTYNGFRLLLLDTILIDPDDPPKVVEYFEAPS